MDSVSYSVVFHILKAQNSKPYLKGKKRKKKEEEEKKEAYCEADYADTCKG